MLKYSLYKNQLQTQRGNYLARTHGMKSYDKNMFIKRLLGKGTLVTETDAVAALNAIENTIIEIIEEGSTLNLPLFNTSFSISGVFDSPDDKYDINRHKLNIKLTKGVLLRNAENKVPVEKVIKFTPLPRIMEVKDILSGEKNGILTPEGVVIVRGHNIKITGNDPACGLWFSGRNGEIKAKLLSENKPSILIAVIPALEIGTWQIKVVTQYTPSEMLKSPKSFIYPVDLTVVA